MANFEAFHLGHFIKPKPLISEECYRYNETLIFLHSPELLPGLLPGPLGLPEPPGLLASEKAANNKKPNNKFILKNMTFPNKQWNNFNFFCSFVFVSLNYFVVP